LAETDRIDSSAPIPAVRVPAIGQCNRSEAPNP
jgi:hypothetical protein